MVVLAFEPQASFPDNKEYYALYTGQVENVYDSNAEIDVGQIVYDELQTLPPLRGAAWGYAYIWKAYIFQSPPKLEKVTSFASIPRRYKLGHLTVNTPSGVNWNDVLTFPDQTTPAFRGSFYKGNPNPGDGFPFGTVPLGDSRISVWRVVSAIFQDNVVPTIKGTYLNIFNFDPGEYIVRITYTCGLSFTAEDILSAAPKPFVVVYP